MKNKFHKLYEFWLYYTYSMYNKSKWWVWLLFIAYFSSGAQKQKKLFILSCLDLQAFEGKLKA
jgi:hypothetical protein